MLCPAVSDSLSDDEVRIRTDVFVEEQGFVVEFDDDDAISKHIVLYDGDVPVAVCRIIPGDDGRSCRIGRVAVSADRRGASMGAAVMEEAERQAAVRGWTVAEVSAQVRARGFYERCGYAAYGDEYMDEHCPHIAMRKHLGASD